MALIQRLVVDRKMYPPFLKVIQKKLSKNDIFCFTFWVAILSKIQGCFLYKSGGKLSIQKKRKTLWTTFFWTTFFGCVEERR